MLPAMYRGERFNSISHTVGAALAAAGGALLVVVAARSGDPWKITACAIYSATLLALYLSSALYHSIRGAAKDVFRTLDYCAIYLLIAGTYTPFSLVSLRGPLGWWIFGAEWGLALVGIAHELLRKPGPRRFSLVLYVLMGWLAVLGIKPLVAALTPHGFAWLVAGGCFYTAGIAFYVAEHRVRHSHGIWHLFVLAGSVSHYGTILYYVA